MALFSLFSFILLSRILIVVSEKHYTENGFIFITARDGINKEKLLVCMENKQGMEKKKKLNESIRHLNSFYIFFFVPILLE